MIRNLVLAALVCFGCAAQLQGARPEKQQVARRNYLAMLNSKHEGVRNSTIFRVLQYKVAYPQDACSDFLKRLQQISLNDPSAKNRSYAFLASAALQDAKLLRRAQPPEFEDEKEAYFARLHDALQWQWVARE
ncbi:MAG: hypothetical protein AAB354_16700 [candidate division KSB1 bacterium]